MNNSAEIGEEVGNLSIAMTALLRKLDNAGDSVKAKCYIAIGFIIFKLYYIYQTTNYNDHSRKRMKRDVKGMIMEKYNLSSSQFYDCANGYLLFARSNSLLWNDSPIRMIRNKAACTATAIVAFAAIKRLKLGDDIITEWNKQFHTQCELPSTVEIPSRNHEKVQQAIQHYNHASHQ